MKRKLRLYLSHTIGIRKDVREWEKYLECKYDIELINPFYDLGRSIPVERLDSGEIEPYSDMNETLANEIVTRDLNAINSSDGILAYVDCASVGTSMEIYHCKQLLMKPVLIYIKNKKLAKHPWLLHFSSDMCNSMSDVERQIKQLKEEIE
jgi:hypothetical protein